MAKLVQLTGPEPPVYFVTPDGKVATPVTLAYLGDKEGKLLHDMKARLCTRKERRAAARAQGIPWTTGGLSPRTIERGK